MTKVPEGFSLDWVDALWKRSGDLFMLRDEDGVFILPPNRVYHLNPTAARIIKWLQAGNSIHDFPGLDSEERQLQVDSFFQNIARALANQTHHAKRIPFTFDYTKLPILGEIAVTYRCNNRCRFCYAGCDGACGRLDSPDIEPEKIERIIDIFKSEAKIPFFSFTGGEPLMRKDLERLMRYAVSKDLKINLVTNGTLATPERAKSLYEAGLRTAQISLESPDEEIHDALCGRKGSWQQTIDGINNLREAGIAVQTNTTSTTMNIDSLERLPELSKKLGCVRMSILWYSPLPMCIYNPLAKGLGNKSCAACDGLISVDPEGNVLPCSSWDEPVGNLLTDGFQNVWFNERAKAIKNKCFAHPVCQQCHAFVACQGACPLYWQYAGYDELERHAWRQDSSTSTTGDAV